MNHVIDLDPDFHPYTGYYTNNIQFETLDFHGGETHFRIVGVNIKPDEKLVITQRYNSVKDLFMIILANDAARRMGFKNIELILPYFPAARQDRVCNVGEPLTLKIFADMINDCNFDKVTIFCPHSEVTPALLNNVIIQDELKYIDRIIDIELDKIKGYIAIVKKDTIVKTFNIVCPDAGAGKRVGKIVQHLSTKFINCQFNLIRCEKVRNVKDGKLEGFFVQSEKLGGHPTIICDDINSMGGTFIGLGVELRKKNCGQLMLFTAH